MAGQKVTIADPAHQVWYYKHEPTDQHVLWCELFKERERSLLRKHLTTMNNNFEVGEFNCGILARTVLREHNMKRTVSGKTVLMLHAMSGNLTTSWAWAKFFEPFYKAGLALVTIDFPGFGLSSIGGKYRAPPSLWRDIDYRIAAKVLLDVLQPLPPDVRLLTLGESCVTAIGMLHHFNEYLDKRMIWHNPVLDLERLFPQLDSGLDHKPPRKKYRRALDAILHGTHGSRTWFWVTHDDSISSQTIEDLNWLSGSLGPRFTVTRLSSNHLCEVHAGCNEPIHIQFPCRQLKRLYTSFLTGELQQPPTSLPIATDTDSQCQSNPSSQCPSTRLYGESGAEQSGMHEVAMQTFQSAGTVPHWPSLTQGAAADGATGRPLGGPTPSQVPTLPRGGLTASAPVLPQSPMSRSAMLSASLPQLDQHASGGKRMPSLPEGSQASGGLRVPTLPEGGQALPSATSSRMHSSRSSQLSRSSYSMRDFAALAQHRLLEDPNRSRERLLANVREVTNIPNNDAPPQPFDESLTQGEREQVEDAMDYSMRMHRAEKRLRKKLEAEAQALRTSVSNQAVGSSNAHAQRNLYRSSRITGSKLDDAMRG